ncbi:MAG: 1-(5-phosphoribosyl)-5-[Clostridia bacterium]|jgi:phosphoribosylformimino-5-aminoimidazole carboxamide ribotide isomerase|nr:1-(5-phosphoribosyl)-5-[(5-phosphoribosylamino)methylideneamino]imidazole-4-carboxamide isomerase [Clostridia bacterium]MBQ2382478.1 1-(5-phosphoribosyl)-5-[(5-phosphoribosylamino)methylideneamino]imidazole-4-carboxamide isomerase [Oscillospiraceae bacterium]MBQ5887308.1 1-(5-phosphoribosyl)-5-[(5-phosphoribosylamino)methylideneamino]imidazole-4-carboxamide isomerase [Clostridia bacterium]
MLIFPAIDLFEGKAVRLLKGEYDQMTVYNEDPLAVARDFAACGATCLHLVDLEGAKSGTTPNIDTIRRLAAETDLFTEVGGGIRNMDTVRAYLSAGVDRVILGTAALQDEAFLTEALAEYGDRIAVGVDIRNGKVAIRGWVETSETDAMEFMAKLEQLGVRTVICTDISRDGAMAGTNHDLYAELMERFQMNVIASGGVSAIEDVRRLAAKNLHGAIIGRAYYTGAISLREAIEVAK